MMGLASGEAAGLLAAGDSAAGDVAGELATGDSAVGEVAVPAPAQSFGPGMRYGSLTSQ
jgi:hypothetical protein